MTDQPSLKELDAELDGGRWCCNGNAEDCALCTDPNPPYPFICPGHPDTPENRQRVQTATEATNTLQLEQRIAEALRDAAHQCDGRCGLSEEGCDRAHPINWSAMVGGTTHVDASVTAISSVILDVLRPVLAEREAMVRYWQTCRDAYADENRALIRQRNALRAELAAARKFAAEMRDFCSPHGVAAGYADRLVEAMDRAKEGQA